MNAVELIPLQSGAANATSAYFDLGGKIDFAIQVYFTGSDLAGVLTLEASVDPSLGWVKVLDSDQSVTSSAGKPKRVFLEPAVASLLNASKVALSCII